MTIRWGRDFEAPLRPGWSDVPAYWRRGARGIYRWGRVHDAMAIQRTRALRYPRATDYEGFALECCFKLYDEVPGEGPDAPRELLIECKICLTVEAWADARWCAQLFPLRGTDWWPIMQLLIGEYGEPETLIHDGADGVIVWFSASEDSREAAAVASEPGEIHDTSRHTGWEDR